MSTSSAAAGTRPAARTAFFDGPFLKRLVILCALVPGVLLVWDAYRGNLGVNEVNYALRSTGMIGLVCLVLALAITPLRWLTRWNVLISVRRNLGVFACLYILAHFIIFFWYDRDGDVGSTLEEIVARTYLWFGTGALVLMIPLALTSTDGMVTRLGAKRWKLLHRAAYLAAIGGVVHFYMLVKSDTSRPFAFAVALGALFVARVVHHELDLRKQVRTARAKAAPAPAAKKKKFWSGELVVARIFAETHDTKTFRFVLPGGGPLPFDHVAGQYINLKLTIGGKRVNRSYTIASAPTRSDYCEISVKRVPDGYASHHLHDAVKEGDTISVSAPAGKFFFAGHEARRVVMLAGGVGITPMMSVVRSLTDRCWTGEMVLLFSVKKRHDIIFEHELDYLRARFPNLRVHVTVSGDPEAAWDGARGHITRELIEKAVPDLRGGPIMMCGPGPMMKAMRELLVGMGVPDAEIHEEAFVSPPATTDDAAADAQAREAEAVAAVEPATGNETAPQVAFARTGKRADAPGGLTVLEAAEECGVAIPFECRSGICGQCKTKLVSGRVTMEVQDALTSGDRAKGLVLACQARAVGDVVVDA
jgi:ferredoxin-NADP reductase/DMSO/TMAO reductase YedYZ heme-binding membrane subunit